MIANPLIQHQHWTYDLVYSAIFCRILNIGRGEVIIIKKKSNKNKKWGMDWILQTYASVISRSAQSPPLSPRQSDFSWKQQEKKSQFLYFFILIKEFI